MVVNNEITQEELKNNLDYDPTTGIFTRVKSYGKVKKGDIAGTLSDSGYIVIRVNVIRYPAHRLAWLYMTGEFPQNEIDHINRIRDDNRFNNLREVSRSKNHMNMSIPSNNKSGVVGVYFHKQRGKYQSQIKINGKNIYLGIYDNFEEAVTARKLAEVEYGFHKNHGNEPTRYI